MTKIHSLLLCRCTGYHRVAESNLERIAISARAMGIDCSFVDDLCFETIQHPEILCRTDAVVGCYPRALEALFLRAGASKPLAASSNENPDKIISDWELTPSCSDKTIPDNSLPVNRHQDQATLSHSEPVTIPISGAWVPWYPVIDINRCIQCKKCVDFCLFGVYTVHENRVQVEYPSNCKTDCPACARMCPQNAIIFPKSPEPPLNGSLREIHSPTPSENKSFAERLSHRKKKPRLFKEDEE